MYKIPTRDKEFGVGKRMGDNLYFHVSYGEEIIGKRKFRKAKRIAEKAFKDKYKEYGTTIDIGCTDEGVSVIKYNKKKGMVSFMFCNEFYDTLEPGVTGYICVDINKETSKIRSYRKDFPIYHHKWLMVGEDFKDFKEYDMEVLKERSKNIEKIMNCDLFEIDVKKIGYYMYWKIYVRPTLMNMKGWQELVLSS